MSSFTKALVNIALREVGVEEVDGSNCGPRVNEYKAATVLNPKEEWPWCAAFVCWVVQQALIKAGISETPTFTRPKTAVAYRLKTWSLAQDDTTWTKQDPGQDILPGDIIVYYFSHCGIAVSKPNPDGYVQVVEGNTDGQGSREGGAVLAKWRKTRQIRARIRFTV